MRKVGSGRLPKTSWLPCARCGNPDGRKPRGCVTPARLNGTRYGFPGQICYSCYATLRCQYREGRPLTPYTGQHCQWNGHRKATWSPCADCGDPDGQIARHAVTPYRASGQPYGINGLICRRCYMRYYTRASRARKFAAQYPQEV